jgi:hypothetical protein
LLKKGEQIMEEYTQSLAIWLAVKSLVARISERRATVQATPSQPEEVFMPFNLPPVKSEATEEAKLPVAVPASSPEAQPVGV